MKPWINLEYFFNKIYEFLKNFSGFLTEGGNIYIPEISKLKPFFFILSLVFFIGIIYVTAKITQLKSKEIKNITQFVPEESPPEDHRTRWNLIQKRIDSPNSSDWKIAILEADTILDEIIKKIGIPGENLGERLKNIEPSDFKNLRSAWKAHKTRNMVAHSGDMLNLSKEEAEDTIRLYEKIFKEFKFL